MHTVKNGTSEVTEELLEKVGLLRRDFVVSITLATVLNIVVGETGAKFGVEDCIVLSVAMFRFEECSARMLQSGRTVVGPTRCMHDWPTWRPPQDCDSPVEL